MHRSSLLSRTASWAVCGITLLALGGRASAEDPTWTTRASMPVALFGAGAAAIDGKVYVAGGVYLAGSDALYSDGLEVYDPPTDTWTAKAPMSAPRSSFHQVVAAGGLLYVIGGSNAGHRVLDTVEAYDPVTDAWSTKAPLPTPLAEAGAAAIGDRIYVVGGDDGDADAGQGAYVSSLYVYDTLTDTWETKASLPAPRQMPSVAVVDGILYAIGGWGSDKATTTVAYDPAADAWTAKADMPEGVFRATVGVVGGKIYAIGGSGTSPGSPISSVQVYDPASDSWSYGPSTPILREEAASATVDGVIYVMGGSTGSPPWHDETEALVVETPPPPAITALAPAEVWLGLKNSDDVGTKFDLLVEVLRNGEVVGSGEADGLSGGSSGFSNAIEREVGLSLPSSVDLASGDVVGVRVSVRVAATGHKSGTARLWYGDAGADSRFGATIADSSDTYYLVGPSTALALNLGSAGGTRRSIDVTVNRNVDGNPFKPFGTWTYVVP